MKARDYTWMWIGGRLVGVPIGVDPARMAVRQVGPDELAAELGIEREQPTEGDDSDQGRPAEIC